MTPDPIPDLFGSEPDDSQTVVRTTAGPSPSQFNLVHDVAVSHDGLVYVADRNNNRIQVFTPDGTFVREAFVARETSTRNGTVYSLAFSSDPEQAFLYVADAGNGRIRVLNRERLEVVDSIGRWGRQAGQFMVPHSIATDSQGNLYVAEIREGRVQKFVRTRYLVAAGRARLLRTNVVSESRTRSARETLSGTMSSNASRGLYQPIREPGGKRARRMR